MKISDKIKEKGIFTYVTAEELEKLQELAQGKKNAVEIGSYIGASSIAIASALHPEGKLFCIDIWKSNKSIRPDPEHGSLFEKFLENTDEYRDRIVPVHTFSELAVQSLTKKIDFLFIDGDHTRPGVERDWNLYRHLLQPGSIVVFHDLKIESVRAVIEERVMGKTKSYNSFPNMWWGEIK